MNSPTETTAAANAALPKITEADVQAWLRAQRDLHAPEFPLLTEFRIKAESGGDFYATGYLNSRYVVGVGPTVRAAVEHLRKQAPKPEELASKLRAQAAKLLADAEKLNAEAA